MTVTENDWLLKEVAERAIRSRDEARDSCVVLRQTVDDLRSAVFAARNLLAEAYSDEEDNDSPGNMAFAVLNDVWERTA